MNILYGILDTLLPFDMFRFAFMKNALLALLLIAPLLGLLGTMAVNNRMAYFSDALGHSALTGIAIGVLLGMENQLICMVAFGILMAVVISRVKAAGSSSTDTVISVFSSLAMALGLVILSRGGGFARYSSYLVGDILAITPADLGLLALTLGAVVVLWIVLFNPLLLTSVNPSLAASRGARVKWVEMAFILAVAVVVMLSIQWVGILMINALLILPAASARNVARSARQYTLLSLAFSLFSGLLGLVLSYLWDVSAGPMIVLILGGIFAVTYLAKARSRSSRAA
ncbi:MAG: metal ABC transporter permease [Christensenellaceae bacterium]